jgi:hypothetical protein
MIYPYFALPIVSLPDFVGLHLRDVAFLAYKGRDSARQMALV